jgi:hypothetical protein
MNLNRPRRFVLVALAALFVVTLLVGGAVRPQVARSDSGDYLVQPMQRCTCYYNAMILQWCYRCCDVYGCYDLYCTYAPNCGL